MSSSSTFRLRPQRERTVDRQVDGDGQEAPCMEGHRTRHPSLWRRHLRRPQHRIRAGAGERDLLRLRASRRPRLFSSFGFLADYASQRDIPVVPVLFAGTFHTEDDLRDFIHSSHAQASALGGEREGVVIRLARSFPASEFSNCVCKSVRARHVQTDHHWTQHWRPCRIVGRVEASRSPTVPQQAALADAAAPLRSAAPLRLKATYRVAVRAFPVSIRRSAAHPGPARRLRNAQAETHRGAASASSSPPRAR